MLFVPEQMSTHVGDQINKHTYETGNLFLTEVLRGQL